MITISRDNICKLAEHSTKKWPEEACALLIGRRNAVSHCNVTRIEISENISDRPEIWFEIDPGLRIGLERELRDKTEEIVGVFHSHPSGPARPSTTDADMVIERHLFWVIGDLSDGQWLTMNAFQPMHDQGFRQVPLTIL